MTSRRKPREASPRPRAIGSKTQTEPARQVERRPDSAGRRAHLVVLTAAGDTALNMYIPHAVTMLDRVVFATLSVEEIEVLNGLLNRVESAARQFAVE
jgi:hypothetical protein